MKEELFRKIIREELEKEYNEEGSITLFKSVVVDLILEMTRLNKNKMYKVEEFLKKQIGVDKFNSLTDENKFKNAISSLKDGELENIILDLIK